MAAEGGGGTNVSLSSHTLQATPVWALATVCFVFISLSLLLEHLIHLLCNWLKRHRKTAMFEAVEKLKSVLILLGFMSLILTVTQRPISKICISTKVAYTMLPCHKSAPTRTTKALGFAHTWTTATSHEHSLPATDVFEDVPWQRERRLAAADTSNASSDHCASQGMTSFMSQDGILQLNNFIFVLAVMQIVYSVLTMALGRAKMRRWEAWEKETQTIDYQVANDPNRFRYTRQTTFGRRHMNSSTRLTTLHLWIKCFFRQFFRSVAKVDYLTLRHGFISAHLSTKNSFNFQKYIQRSLEDDFKAVVGISPLMWFLVVIFLLVDVHGWHVYFWISFLPLIIGLALGTKLEVIVARMALQLQDQNLVIKGAPVVQPNDNLFWFNHPKFVLTFLHYTLFMNAFELAFFVWVTWQYGIKSCYHQSVGFIIIRIILAVIVQVLCSYITLPLYALVTQMGSQFKGAALEEQTVHVVKQWYAETRDRRKKQQDFSQTGRDRSSSTVSSSNRTTGSLDLSSHHRSHPFGEIEIVEEGDNQETHQDELELGMVSSNIVQIELSEVTKIPS